MHLEAVLNSRPLCPRSEDPNDLSALTPSHFLIGQSITAVPDSSWEDIPINRLSRWQYIQRLTQQFWGRWHKDYIPQLQVRVKWQKPASADLQVGDLVLLKADNLPPMQWKLGRVTLLHPGVDGTPRVAMVKTVHGEVKRSVNKLCVLPIEQ